ncbi:MAG: DUF1768 domain-containing protein [Gammaproteobacteria bacterium]|nr:DUF1768 domain-containing protein [Gammaproteobacteria bacterium]
MKTVEFLSTLNEKQRKAIKHKLQWAKIAIDLRKVEKIELNSKLFKRSDCAVFFKVKDEYGGMSNMAGGFPLVINGIRVPSSEALYQACRFPEYPEVQQEIISQKSPLAAKMKTRPHRRNRTRLDWFKIDVSVMRWCLRIKLCLNQKIFGDLLLSTGNRVIVEQSWKDARWGAISESESGPYLIGYNTLGLLLMELREEYRKNTKIAEKVQPPNIKNFKLLDQKVNIVRGTEKYQHHNIAPPPGIFVPINFAADTALLSKNTWVRHAKFGLGKIISCNENRVEISFPNAGKKILALKYAGLERMQTKELS